MSTTNLNSTNYISLICALSAQQFRRLGNLLYLACTVYMQCTLYTEHIYIYIIDSKVDYAYEFNQILPGPYRRWGERENAPTCVYFMACRLNGGTRGKSVRIMGSIFMAHVCRRRREESHTHTDTYMCVCVCV